MNDDDKSREQLIEELESMRQQADELSKQVALLKEEGVTVSNAPSRSISNTNFHYELARRVAERTVKLTQINTQLRDEIENRKRVEQELRVYQIELEMQNDELRDIQRQLEVSYQNYQQLYEFAPVGYFTFDEQGVILRLNLTGATILGRSRQRLIEKPFLSFVIADDHAQFVNHKQTVLETKKQQTCEIRLRKPDNIKVDVQLESIIAHDKTGEQMRLHTAVLDITERKQTEVELAAYQVELEELVQERTAALSEINEQLSHEITERKRAEKNLQRLALTDDLTQIANRRRFDSYLTEMWGQVSWQQRPFAMLLCDLDYFRLYNQEYGHQAGDECLRKVAETINWLVKPRENLVARYRGEEFAVLLPRTDNDRALQIANLIQTEINNLQIVHEQSPTSQYITVSLGVACTYPEPTSSVDEFVVIAEQALSEAKSRGHNAIVLKTF